MSSNNNGLELIKELLKEEQNPVLRQVLATMELHIESGIPIEDLAKAQDAYNDSLKMSFLTRQLENFNSTDSSNN